MSAGRPSLLTPHFPRRYDYRSQYRHAHSNHNKSTGSRDTTKKEFSISRLAALTNDAIKHVQQSLQLLAARRHLDGSDEKFVSLLFGKTRFIRGS